MDNPILDFVLRNASQPISGVRAELCEGYWIVTVRFSGLQRESVSWPEPGVKMTVRSKPTDARCKLPIGTSHEVVEMWIREVAEIGGSRDYARTSDGGELATYPIRWACDYRRASAERTRTGYLFGSTWPLRALLRKAGLRWATDRKAWYGPLEICRELADAHRLTLWTKPVTCKAVKAD